MLNDPTLATAIAAALEKTLNHALRYDPGTRHKLSELEGCRVKIVSTAPEFCLCLSLRDQQIEVGTLGEGTADVEISGRLIDFLQALGREGHSLADSGLRIAGNLGRLNQLKAIFSNVDIDWEEALIEVFGTLAGHALAQAIRSGWQWARQQHHQVETFLPPYLTEELKLLPSATELSSFYQQVDEFRAGVERLGARIARLEKKFTSDKHS